VFAVFEFQVDSIDSDGRVLGRNGEIDIPVGTTFTAIRRCEVIRESDGYRIEDLGEAGRVALSLREVHWYRRTIDVVPGGHTAALVVVGDGLDVLAALLRVLPRHECISLVAPPLGIDTREEARYCT
jgi:hypothetical protein